MAGYFFPGELPFPLQNIRHEFDQLLDRVWHGGINTPPLDGQDWAPCIDAVDDGERYVVRIEVAGLSAEDVEVSVLGSTLMITGCKPRPAKKGEGSRVLRGECRFGSFSRKLELPSAVQDDAVSASCRNGVLELVVPKKAEARGRTIRVNAAGPGGGPAS